MPGPSQDVAKDGQTEPKHPVKKTSGVSRKSGSEQGNGTNVAARRSASRGSDRTVKRLRLSKALTIPESSTVADACRRMAARRVDAALLTDSNTLLCGIITDKDVAMRVVADGLNPSEVPVSQIMTRNPVFVLSDMLATDALQKMVNGKFRHLPVVENGEVVALLDITKCLYDAIACLERAAEKGHAIAAAVEGVEKQFSDTGTGFVDMIRDRMFRPSIGHIVKAQTSRLPTVVATDSIATASRRMKDCGTSSVIVTATGKPQGILTSKDVLLRVLALGHDPAETQVSAVMTSSPESVTMDTSIVDALHTMHDGKFLHLPVVDKSGTCVAVLDVLQLTHGAVTQASSGAAEQENMLQRFWDSALAADDGREDDFESVPESDLSYRQREGVPRQEPSSSSHMLSFTYKVEDDMGRTHRIVTSSHNLSDLALAIAQRIGVSVHRLPPLTYVDDEGDVVVLSSDEDLHAAVIATAGAGRKVLKLLIAGGSRSRLSHFTDEWLHTPAWSHYSSRVLAATAVACVGVGVLVFLRQGARASS